jgi:hypothetical protein
MAHNGARILHSLKCLSKVTTFMNVAKVGRALRGALLRSGRRKQDIRTFLQKFPSLLITIPSVAEQGQGNLLSV